MLRAQPQWQDGEFMLLELTIADTGEGLISRRNSVSNQPLVRVKRTRAQRAVGWALYLPPARGHDGWDLTLNSVPGEGQWSR